MRVEIGPYPSGESIYEKQHVRVEIDYYDTWSMDETLAVIVLPMLKQLRDTKHGSQHVELEDVPEVHQLHGSSRHETPQYDLFPSKEYDEMCWNAMHARWDWVLNEMIFAFECLAGEFEDWEDQFWSGESDIYFEELLDDEELSEVKFGPNHTREWDREGYIRWAERMENGFRLFGKYYRGLWD